MNLEAAESEIDETRPQRRSLLFGASAAVMALGLSSGYGMFAWLISVFLYPFRGVTSNWQFLSDLGSFEVGRSMTYESPAGRPEDRCHTSGQRWRRGRLCRFVERLSSSGLPGSLGIEQQSILLPVPQRSV